MSDLPYKHTLEIFMKLSKSDNINDCLIFVKPAIQTIQNRLRDDKTVIDEVYELYFAAASLAFYNAAVSDELSRYSSFKAGNVRVDFSEKSLKETAENLLKTSLALAKPYLKSGIILKSTGGVKH